MLKAKLWTFRNTFLLKYSNSFRFSKQFKSLRDALGSRSSSGDHRSRWSQLLCFIWCVLAMMWLTSPILEAQTRGHWGIKHCFCWKRVRCLPPVPCSHNALSSVGFEVRAGSCYQGAPLSPDQCSGFDLTRWHVKLFEAVFDRVLEPLLRRPSGHKPRTSFPYSRWKAGAVHPYGVSSSSQLGLHYHGLHTDQASSVQNIQVGDPILPVDTHDFPQRSHLETFKLL